MARHFMTEAQRNEVLRVYVMEGYEASKPLAIKYGVNPHYIAELARRRGFYGNRQSRRFKDSKRDPRWERARAIGLVVAGRAAPAAMPVE